MMLPGEPDHIVADRTRVRSPVTPLKEGKKRKR